RRDSNMQPSNINKTIWWPQRDSNPVFESGQLALQLLDARGHDVHELVNFLARDAERRREPHDLAARVDDRAPVPRLAIEPGDQLLVERPARAVGRYELGAHHEPAAAHLADDALLAVRLRDAVE